MPAGTGLTMAVSGVLRKAGLPVRRYSDTYYSRENSMRVGTPDVQLGTCNVYIHYDADHAEAADDAAKKATAVLIGRGFEVSRHDGHSGESIMLTVKRPKAPVVEDVHTVVAASGLGLVGLTRTVYSLDYDGKRSRFFIERTGGEKTPRWTVKDNRAEYGTPPILSKAHSMQAAIDALTAHIEEIEQAKETEQ